MIIKNKRDMEKEKYDIELIKQVALRDSRYCFVSEGYRIPAFMYYDCGRKIINLKDNIAKSKENAKSKYVRKFKKDILGLRSEVSDSKKKLYSFIQEFPIPIEDIELWNNILTQEGIPLDNIEYRQRRYFILDFLFPYPGFIVEIDSGYHDSRKQYDRARDIYIKSKYGLETFRSDRYGESVITERYDLEYTRDVIGEKIGKLGYYYNESPVVLDFSKIIVKNYIIANKPCLEFVEKLKEYLGGLFRYDTIVITRLDLSKVDPYTFVCGLRKDQELLFIETMTSFIRELYKKRLHVYNTDRYSLGDVLRLIELVSSGQFTWDDFCGRVVGIWITELIGFPPPQYTNLTTPPNFRITIPPKDSIDDTNDGIKNFVGELERAGIIHPFWKPSKPNI